MAQGQLKKTKAPAVKLFDHLSILDCRSTSDTVIRTQRKQTGARVIKPKNARIIKQQQMNKKHSAGLTALTEKSLASRAGHLEMLSGGKKDRKAAAIAAAAATAEKRNKAASTSKAK